MPRLAASYLRCNSFTRRGNERFLRDWCTHPDWDFAFGLGRRRLGDVLVGVSVALTGRQSSSGVAGRRETPLELDSASRCARNSKSAQWVSLSEPRSDRDFERVITEVVAGACNQRFLRLVEREVPRIAS